MLESIIYAATRVMRYLIFLFNFVFVLLGISLITVGVILRSSSEKYLPVFKDFPNYTTAPDLIIFLGVIVFFIAFFGCCGALSENHCMIFTFGVLMVAILIAGLMIGVTGYMMKANASDALAQGMNYSMYRYGGSPEDTALWDKIQTDFDCCGIQGAKDWLPVLNNTLPLSCCTSTTGQTGVLNCTMSAKELHKIPCLGALSALIEKNSSTIGLTGIIIAAIQVLGILFSCILSCKFRNSYESV